MAKTKEPKARTAKEESVSPAEKAKVKMLTAFAEHEPVTNDAVLEDIQLIAKIYAEDRKEGQTRRVLNDHYSKHGSALIMAIFRGDTEGAKEISQETTANMRNAAAVNLKRALTKKEEENMVFIGETVLNEL